MIAHCNPIINFDPWRHWQARANVVIVFHFFVIFLKMSVFYLKSVVSFGFRRKWLISV